MKKILQFVEKLVKSKLKDNSLKIMETFNSRKFVKRQKYDLMGVCFLEILTKNICLSEHCVQGLYKKKIKVFWPLHYVSYVILDHKVTQSY